MSDGHRARLLPALGAASALAVIFVAVLSLPLRTADELGLTPRQATGWIMALYGIPGVLTLVLVARHRQPLLVTGNVFVLIFVASLGTSLTWPELVGASMAAGLVVGLLSALGVVGRISTWVPAPVVFGILAGAVLHFFVDLFTATGEKPVIVGGTLVTYLVARRLTEPRVPAVLPALVAGVVLAALSGELGAAPTSVDLVPALTSPDFSLGALVTAVPVMVVLITLQANLPSMVFLRQQGYVPPEGTIGAVSSVGTVVGSLLGPMGVSLSLPATALCAGPDAGEREFRHWAAYLAGAFSLAIGLGAGLATELARILPPPLLVGLVGLAVIRVLSTALAEVVTGPLRLGPLFAFAIAQSELELVGLGPFFWALAGGLVVSRLLEPDGWRRLTESDPA